MFLNDIHIYDLQPAAVHVMCTYACIYMDVMCQHVCMKGTLVLACFDDRGHWLQLCTCPNMIVIMFIH